MNYDKIQREVDAFKNIHESYRFRFESNYNLTTVISSFKNLNRADMKFYFGSAGLNLYDITSNIGVGRMHSASSISIKNLHFHKHKIIDFFSEKQKLIDILKTENISIQEKIFSKDLKILLKEIGFSLKFNNLCKNYSFSLKSEILLDLRRKDHFSVSNIWDKNGFKNFQDMFENISSFVCNNLSNNKDIEELVRISDEYNNLGCNLFRNIIDTRLKDLNNFIKNNFFGFYSLSPKHLLSLYARMIDLKPELNAIHSYSKMNYSYFLTNNMNSSFSPYKNLRFCLNFYPHVFLNEYGNKLFNENIAILDYYTKQNSRDFCFDNIYIVFPSVKMSEESFFNSEISFCGTKYKSIKGCDEETLKMDMEISSKFNLPQYLVAKISGKHYLFNFGNFVK